MSQKLANQRFASDSLADQRFVGILDRKLIIVGGKGGVGRTTVAAALGTVLARRGKRTLLAHVRCKQRLDALLDAPVVDTKIRQVRENLWAVNMTPAAAIEEMGLMVLKFRTIYKAVFESRVVKYFLRAVPALEEYSMIGKTWYHTTEKDNGAPRFDTVIFDGPATGHLISMLAIPGIILDTVPPGPLSRDAARVQALMCDPTQTGLWLVTLAEEMPTSETFDLERAAREQLGIARDALVVNMLYPDPAGTDDALGGALAEAREALRGRGDDAEAALASAATMAMRHDINQEYLGRLAEGLDLPQVHLPHLFVDDFDHAAVAVLADKIERTLEERAL